MERIEYRTVDKSQWPRGEWDDEPDKIQWADEITGLPCLAVRGPVGSWCGYVGVAPGHPLYGVAYNGCTQTPACGTNYCDHSPETLVSVHGGITFTDRCSDASRERWQSMRAELPKTRKTAAQYPRGDAARWLKNWEPLLNDYEAWRAQQRATSICHTPGAGESDDVWWLGFDCAHAGDLSPQMVAYLSPRMPSLHREEVYRNVAYVTEQCAELAAQLIGLATKPRLFPELDLE